MLETRYLGTKDLLAALDKAGIPHNYRWVLRQEQRGRLKCPRDPSNNFRVFTRKQINEIVKAFLPGGNRVWKHRAKNTWKFLKNKKVS